MATTAGHGQGRASQGAFDPPVRGPRGRRGRHAGRMFRCHGPGGCAHTGHPVPAGRPPRCLRCSGGLALLARGESRWFASSGTADTSGTPITETTRFRIASITKPIVAALVLDAVDRGEVALEDVVGDLLPGTVREDPPITVRQLLDHTSGVVDITNELTTAEALQADIDRLPDKQIRAQAQAALDGSLAGQQVIAPAPGGPDGEDEGA
jgi:CubicO group peptidase (beta-lactamase class C family)